MKIILALCLMFSLPALAVQNIECKEVTKTGKLKKNGGQILLTLEKNKNGILSKRRSSIEVIGFARGKNDPVFDDLKIRSLSESPKASDKNYATLFILPKHDDGMFDLQLQFDTRILGASFKKEKATFVIVSEDANPDIGFAIGFDLTCKSTLD